MNIKSANVPSLVLVTRILCVKKCVGKEKICLSINYVKGIIIAHGGSKWLQLVVFDSMSLSNHDNCNL